jgi:hypothetical protein
MQHRHIPTELPPFSKGGARGDLRTRKIPLSPPFPKGEVKASTTKRSPKHGRIAAIPVALLLRSSITKPFCFIVRERKILHPPQVSFFIRPVHQRVYTSSQVSFAVLAVFLYHTLSFFPVTNTFIVIVALKEHNISSFKERYDPLIRVAQRPWEIRRRLMVNLGTVKLFSEINLLTFETAFAGRMR